MFKCSFDAGYDKIITIFLQWENSLANSKYLLSNYKDIDIIVRAHPDESRYKAKTTTKSLIGLYKNNDNIKIFSGLINTYI